MLGWRAGARRAASALACIVLAAPALAQTEIPKTSPNQRPTPGWSAEVTPSELTATAYEILGTETRTRLSLVFNGPVTYNLATLADPYRIVIDVPNLAFRLPADAGRKRQGLIAAFRFGVFAPGKSRIVIDTTGPVTVEHALAATGSAKSTRLTLELAPTEAASYQPSPPVEQPIAGTASESPRGTLHDHQTARPDHGSNRPTIVLDPGHGGVDGGANTAEVLEKDVVLAVAKFIQATLDARGTYNVKLTRSTDIFVSLDQRIAASRAAGADLFISIYADSISQREFAQNIRGATVYTLSEQASNREAQLLAEKENAVDARAGINVKAESEDDQVKNILIDLLTRETQAFSNNFRGILISNLKPAMPLARDPSRSAAFKVLKQTQTPSVLLELGYISNAKDAELLRSTAWQRQVATAIAASIDAYFAKRLAGNR